VFAEPASPGSAWIEFGYISGSRAFDHFGHSVAMSADGSRIAVGTIAPTNAQPGEPIRGVVTTYQQPTAPDTSWTRYGFFMEGEADGDAFGWSVAMSATGNHVVVGAPYNDDGDLFNINKGHARVYEWNGVSWSQYGLDINGAAISDYAGYSVAMSADGSRVAVGAREHDGNARDSGHVRVFDRPALPGDSWSQIGDAISGTGLVDWFGHSVAMSADGSRVAAGAIANDDGFTNSGHVRVFSQPIGSGSAWVQVGSNMFGEARDDQFGFSVAMSESGSRLVVGAITNEGNGGPLSQSGHARVFEYL
jgi:FG-GAP repeat